MSLPTLRSENLVYWAPSAYDGDGGWTYAAPVQIKGRWQEETHRLGDTDETVVTEITVYPSQAVSKQGWLWRGLLVDIPNADPQQAAGAYRIRDANVTRSPNGSLVLWKAIC